MCYFPRPLLAHASASLVTVVQDTNMALRYLRPFGSAGNDESFDSDRFLPVTDLLDVLALK